MYFPTRVSLIKIRTLVVDFYPLQTGSFLLPVQSLLGGALTSSGEKWLVFGFSRKSNFQFTHKLDVQIAVSQERHKPKLWPQKQLWVCDIYLKPITKYQTSSLCNYTKH